MATKPPLEKTNEKKINQNLNKRNHDDVDPDSDNEIPNHFPKFLVIHGTDDSKPLKKLSPFAIQKGIQGIAGIPEKVQRLRSGDILVEVSRRSHSTNLLRSKMLVDIPVKITPHRSLNSTKGVIRSRDLMDCEEEEILDNLRPQGVTCVKKIVIRRDGNTRNTGTIILTFGIPTLPTHVKCAYLNLPVDVYIPNPMRCFKCQKFRHHKNNCRRSVVCARCGSDGHEDTSCEATTKCINCLGNHPAFSRDCPQWVREKEVQVLKLTRGMSFPEARKYLEERNTASKAPSYAEVANPKKMVASGCQTDLTWLSTEQPSLLKHLSKSRTSSSDSKTISIQTEQAIVHVQSDDNEKLVSVKPRNKMAEVNNPKPSSSKSKLSQFKTSRAKKGSDDPIKNYNRFGALEDMEAEDFPIPPTPNTITRADFPRGRPSVTNPITPPD